MGMKYATGGNDQWGTKTYDATADGGRIRPDSLVGTDLDPDQHVTDEEADAFLAAIEEQQAPPAIDVEAERAYVNNYISGRDAALRSALIARVGDAVGRNAAADIVDAAWRDALAATPPATTPAIDG